MVNYVNKLVKSLSRAKGRLDTQSKQRRGGVTDLYALDYQSEINNPGPWGYGYNGTRAGVSKKNRNSDESTATSADRVATLAKAIKSVHSKATAIGIAGVVGNFGIESDVKAERYETDYLTDYKYDLMNEEPTVEKLVGSWFEFAKLYRGVSLNKEGYQVGDKHFLGIGLGQWTGPRAKALWDFASAQGLDIFSFQAQVEFMFQEPVLSDILEGIVELETSVEDSVEKFLTEWEGVPGNKLSERIQYAKDNLGIIQNVLNGSINPTLGTTPHTGSDSAPDINTRTEAKFRVLVPADLDRFQRWFIKVIIISNAGEEDDKYNIVPLSDVTLTIQAKNFNTGETINRDVTELLRSKHPCDWIGSNTDSEAVYPNEDPLEGYDIMDIAWYLNDEERNALFSAGEKLFIIRALGNAKVTLRNFLKFSHIN